MLSTPEDFSKGSVFRTVWDLVPQLYILGLMAKNKSAVAWYVLFLICADREGKGWSVNLQRVITSLAC